MQKHYHVWDIGLRAFHWLLVFCIVFSYISIDIIEDTYWHAYFGWAIASLLVFRVCWGCITRPTYASFHRLTHALRSVRPYSLSLLKGNSPTWLGHNPLGSASVCAFFALLLLLIVTGLCLSDDIDFDGALYPYVPSWVSAIAKDVHESVFNLLVALIALHIAAIVFYTYVKKQHLVRSMIKGSKSIPSGVTIADDFGSQRYSFAFCIRAVIALALSLAVSWSLFIWWL